MRFSGLHGATAAALLLPSLLAASQSLVLSAAVSASISLPKGSPYQRASQQAMSFRFQFRLHNWSPGKGNYSERTVFTSPLNGFWCTIGPDSVLTCVNWWDQIDESNVFIDLKGRPDVVVTVQREANLKQFSMQVCNVNLNDCVTSQVRPIKGLARGPAGAGDISAFTFGAPGTSLQIAWFRWVRGGVPFSPPRENDPPGDLLDLPFEGSGQASTPALIVAPGLPPPPAPKLIPNAGHLLFVTTPVYPPGCIAGPQKTLRAGFPAILDGTGSVSLNGQTQLQWHWEQVSGPDSVFFENANVAQPKVTGLQFGTYVFRLTVKDSLGQSNTCVVTHGAVASDDNSVVITGNRQFDHFVSPLLMWGKNPWPWYDAMANQTGQLFVGKLGNTFAPVWRNPSPHGTLNVPVNARLGGTDITGNATSFATDYFRGSCKNAWDNTNYVVVWYTTPWGTPGYRFMTPVSCADDLHMKLRESTHFLQEPLARAAYATIPDAELAKWINGSNNANYYDNVLAYYTLWRSTGLDYWHDAATTLADLWWESPGIDQGQSCSSGPNPDLGLQGYWCPPNRVLGLFGMMLRALDGKPGMWSGLYAALDAQLHYLPKYGIGDTREDSARMGQVCAGAMLMHETGSTDSARMATYKKYCHDMVVTHFAPAVKPHGEFAGPQYGYSTANMGWSAITVTKDSRVVTSSGRDFPCSLLVTGIASGASRLWVVANGNQSSFTTEGGDPMTYAIDSCTPASLTLHNPYTGMYAGSGRGYALNPFGGSFSQPFIMGYMAGQFAVAAEALHSWGDASAAAVAEGLTSGLAKWIVNSSWGGYRPATGGLFYVRGGLTSDGAVGGPNGGGGCEPDPEVLNNNGGICTGVYAESDSVQSSRFLGAETFRGIAHGYIYSQDQDLKAAADNLFGKIWGGSGGIGADGNYISNFFPSAETGKAKDFGFCCGLGGGGQWAAARLGGALPTSSRVVTVPVEPGTDGVLLTVTQPSGVSLTTVCSIAPCSVTVDARLGDHTIKVRRRDSSGRAVSGGSLMPLPVPKER